MLANLDICQLIDDTVDLTSARINQKQVKIRKKLKGLDQVCILGDHLQLKEVFHNIMNNAFDAVKEKTGVVVIRGCRQDTMVEITVEDNGSGIEEVNLKRLFEPFFTTKSRGTGLGLTVSREIVTMHHGDIGIESEKGKGTRVIVRLPAIVPGGRVNRDK